MRSLLGGRRAPHASSAASATDGPGIREAVAAWAVWGVVAAGVWETYAGLPAIELYNVTGTGFAAGGARTLVFLNRPVAIAAVAIVVVAADRLLAGPISATARRATVAASAAAVLLCSTIALPGILDPNDLDARAANVPAAVGVLVALAVTVCAAGVRGAGRREPMSRGDRLALAAVPLFVVAALPWILAGVGVYAGDVPVLDDVYVSKAVAPERGEPQVPAVHLGNHEGIDGLLLAADAFALRRALRRMRATGLRRCSGRTSR